MAIEEYIGPVGSGSRLRLQNYSVRVDKSGWAQRLSDACLYMHPDSKETRQIRFSICTLPGYVDHISRAARKHWPIENRLHGILEAALKDDHRRVHEDQAPEICPASYRFQPVQPGKTAAAGIHASISSSSGPLGTRIHLLQVLIAGG